MARLPRLVIPGQLHLLVQRSHGAGPVFGEDEDFSRYLDCLGELAPGHGVAIHAYALMPQQVLLLATPSAQTSLSRLLQALGRRFGADYNRRHQRTGVLWDGRFRATVVDAEAHWLDCSRYVETAPLRALLTDAAREYAWSSAAHHIGRRSDAVVTEHARYWHLGNTPFEREAIYRSLLEQPLAPSLERRIADASLKGWALGPPAFAEAMNAMTGRRVTPLSRGRPRQIKTVPK